MEKITGEKVQEAFRKIRQTAGSMDGWATKELTMLSPKTCQKVAVLFNLIEAGAGWPTSALHARIVYLETWERPLEKS